MTRCSVRAVGERRHRETPQEDGYRRLRPAVIVSAVRDLEKPFAKGSMFRGWGSEVDGHENATLNQHRETAAGEAGADEIEQGSPCLARR